MEDYNSNLLNDSKNEWSIRLMNLLSGHIIDGFRSIFNEALEMCEQNEEPEKYLMTFQNFLSRIPKWNQTMIETEAGRIIEQSRCKYLDDLITCVHIIQLKILSCVRTSNHNKKIEIDIPNFTSFLHNVYINIARKLYGNIYLFQVDVSSLEQQKNNREFEVIVQSCIMNTIRDNIPIDQLLKQYIDETQEIDIEKTEKVIEKQEIVEKTEENQESSATIAPTSSISDEKKAPEVAPIPPLVEDAHITFSETNKALDMGTNKETEEEMKDGPLQLGIEDEDDNFGDPLQIGESISLNFDDSLEPKQTSTPEPEIMNEVIDLGIESLEEPSVKSEKNDIIDLGATELEL